MKYLSESLFNTFHKYPFTNSHYWYCFSNKEEEKWKINPQPQMIPFSLYAHFLLFLHLLIFSVRPVTCQAWDGVIVTQADFQALQAFKQELVDPKGFLRSWNDSGYGACSGGWEGIKCAQGQVIVIQLPWRGLGGKITEKIGQLQGLRKLSLHDNLIGGSIPRSLGIIPNLRGVQLFNNRLSGSIPTSLGSCPLLQTLDLGNNSLVGNIPESLGHSSKLFRLNVSFNSLSGSIPVSLTNSSSLIFLALQYNNLSGSLPSSFNKVSAFQEVTMSNNQITGSLPSEIGRLSRLRILDISNNALNGSLPVSLSNLSSLIVLNLKNNKLNSKIPEEIWRLQNLSVLNLKRNQISGQIPETIGNISTLTQLDLSLNNISGGIPNSLAKLANLNTFNVSYNNLSGPVPTPLAQKFNSSSFIGNIQLCGFVGGAPCPSQAPSQSVPSPPPKAPKRKHHKLTTKDIILIATGALLIVLFILCCVLLCCLIRTKTEQRSRNGQPMERATVARGEKGAPAVAGEVEAGGETGGRLVHFDGPMVFTADDLLCATAEVMGKSTYGTVYKATLEDGSQVAVKRLREKITKGHREFETEVNVLGKVRHPNLLALRAYYLGLKGEKLLVLDYMPRGNLATFLHARGPEASIDWPTRMRIIKGMTRGLLHLHNNENIIHGNLTSSNVLLDEHANAKIADYGLSRLMTAAANTNVIATASALGYRAPELSKLKNANTKTDVYSLGVIILELLTGKSPSEVMNGVDLPQWVASIVKEEWTNEVFDLELMRDAPIIGNELLNTLKLALHCIDPSPSARPEVQQVLQQLEEIRPEEAAAASSSVPSGDGAGEVPSTSE